MPDPWDEIPDAEKDVWDTIPDSPEDKSYLEIIAEKIRPSNYYGNSSIGTQAAIGEAIIKAAILPQDALVALHKYNKYGQKLEETFKERFRKGRSPHEVLPQIPGVPGLPDVEFQALLQDIAYDPLNIPAGGILKVTGLGEKILSGLSKVNKVEDVLSGIAKLGSTEDALALGKTAIGNEDAIGKITKMKDDLFKLAKEEKDIVKRGELQGQAAYYSEAEKQAKEVGVYSSKDILGDIDRDIENALTKKAGVDIEEEVTDPIQLAKIANRRGSKNAIKRAKESLKNYLGEENIPEKSADELISGSEFDKTIKRSVLEQPLGEKPSTTLGYNTETMHPKLKDDLPQIIEDFRVDMGFDEMRGNRLTTKQAVDTAIKKAGLLNDETILSLSRENIGDATDMLANRIYVNNRLHEIADDLNKIPITAGKQEVKDANDEIKHALNMYFKVRSQGSETARSLYYMRVQVDDNLMSGMKKFQQAFEKIDPESAKKFGEMIKDAENIPGAKEKLLFWWYNGMLSNPFTDLANITGNASHIGWEFAINSLNNPKSVYRMYKELPKSIAKASKNAWKIAKSEERALSKFTKTTKIRYDVMPKSKLGKGLKNLLPTTRLAWEDEFFSTIAKEMRTSLGKSSIAKKTGISYDDVTKNMEKVLSDPKFKLADGGDKAYRELADYADKYADYITFKSPLKSKFGQGLQETTWIKPIVPFARVTANISKAGYKNTPLGLIKLMGKEGRAMSTLERQDVVRRALAGTVFFTGIGSLMANGKIEISGSGPENKKDRELWDAMGYKPNHIYWVDDNGKKTGISYQNINPFNVVLAVMGNWQDQYKFGNKLTAADKTLTEKLSYALGGAAQTMTDQSFMQGVSALFKWIQYKDEAYLEDFFTKPFIPNIVGVGRNIREYATGDKPRYEARNWWERVKRRVGLNEGLIPTESTYGGQKQSGFERFPYFPTTVNPEPILSLLDEKNLRISVPSKRTKIGDRLMTDMEYADYVKISGQNIMNKLRQRIRLLSKLDSERAQDRVNSIVDKEREKAKRLIKLNARKIKQGR